MRLRAALTAGFAALVLAAPAQADTFSVTNGSSDVAAGCTGTTCPSLRAAIAAAEITRLADIINVPSGTININNDLVVASDMTIVGTSARTNIIDGGAKYRGLRVAAGATVSFSHFTIRNAAAGQGGSDDGGGVVNSGTLTLAYVHVTTSRATRGGGVANLSPGLLSLQHTLIDGNTSGGTGGGIVNVGSVETTPITYISMTDSTVFGNTANGGAGGIANLNNGGLLLMTRVTVADNLGSTGSTGGLLTGVAQRSQVTGSILARNKVGAATSNCGAIKPTNGGFNVEDNDTCALGLTADPVLDTKLANAGGELDVLPIGGASPAVNRVPNGDNCVAGTPDQRDLYRPQGSACDSGAYELDVAATYTITGGPSGTISSDSAQIDFSSSDPSATPECQLTGPGQAGGYGPCYKSNTALYTNLANGTFTFSVRDSDFPGSTPATRTFTVAALDSTITGGPTGPTNDTTPTFTFTGANGAVSFQCRFDAATFASCASPFTPTVALAPGAHTFEVRALSASGAPENTPASRSFTIDTTAPDTTIASGPREPTNDATPTFTFTASEPATFECSIDGAAFAACPTPFTTPSLAQGAHQLAVRAADAAGNRDNTPATRTFTLDLTPPPAPAISGPDGATTETSPAFAFSAADAVATACRLDGPSGAVGEFGECASPKAFSGLAPGDYVFFVRSTDAAGNTQTTQRAFTVTVAQQATPTPTSTATPTPTPGPVDGVSVGAKPVQGTVLVKQPGTTTFVPLSPSLIKLGAEVDARKGTVEITRSDGGVAKFYDGIFKLSQSGGYTVLTLSEKLTGCPKAKKSSASAAAKKPKSRKLWGDGKGKFRTKGQYSAATVRGTIWLVQDTCTTTLTRVKQGVVEVQDLVKKKKVLVKAPKSYTARAKKK